MQIKLKFCLTLFSLPVHKYLKLKTKFNTFLTEWFSIQREFTTPFEEISPKELNKCLLKFYLSTGKRDGRSVIARQNCNEIVGNSKSVKNHHFCAQLSHCFSIY